MRILFDAHTPAPLARFLRGHEVTRADELGWQGLDNGALLDAAEQAGFEVLLTCDQNVRYQQNLASRKMAYSVLEHMDQTPDIHPTSYCRALAAGVIAELHPPQSQFSLPFLQTGLLP